MGMSHLSEKSISCGVSECNECSQPARMTRLGTNNVLTGLIPDFKMTKWVRTRHWVASLCDRRAFLGSVQGHEYDPLGLCNIAYIQIPSRKVGQLEENTDSGPEYCQRLPISFLEPVTVF